MADTGAEPKLVLPQLQSFYDFAIPLAWPIVRIAAGWNLLVHGWGKVARGPDAFAKGFADMGFQTMTMAWVWGSLAIELVGGIALIVGLFTRFFAAALAIEFAVITFVAHWSLGFFWNARGYEYPLVLGIIFFAIALRGGGPLSIDQKYLKKEL